MDMIVLDTTAKSIRAVLGEAHTTNPVDITAGYADVTASAITEGANEVASNGTTPVTVVAAPSASTRRVVRQLNVYNNDTVQHIVTVSVLVTATTYNVKKVTLAAGESVNLMEDPNFLYTDAAADGVTKGKAAFTAADFNASSGVISLDYTNGQKASDTQAGFLTELATIAETNTGTDAVRAVTPDGLAGSNLGIRLMQLKVINDVTTLTTGDGKIYFCIPIELNGMNLVSAHAFVSTNSSSGTPTIQIANVTDTTDMLSTRITIDANEPTSYTAAAPPVIDTTKDDVATGDILRVDVDVAGTGAKGLGVILSFQLP